MTFLVCLFLLVVVSLIINLFLNENRETTSKSNLEKYNIQKGKMGEDYICNLLKKNIVVYHKIVRNVYIPYEDRRTEIDILFITSFGIFVIESKNYDGYIYGNEEDYKWTEYFNENKKYQIMNPIKQNNHHIKFLSDYLKKDIKDFKSYIVFGNNTKLKKIKYNHIYTTITKAKHLIPYIIDNMHNSNIIYSHEEVDKIYIDLKYYCEHSNIEYSDNI